MNSYLLYVNLQLHDDISQKPITHSKTDKQDTIPGLFKNCDFYRQRFLSRTECGCGLDWSRSRLSLVNTLGECNFEFYKTRGIS